MFQPISVDFQLHRSKYGGVLLPLGFFAICAAVMWPKVIEMDFATIWVALSQVGVDAWCISAIATWLSLRAVGRYDAIWHDILRSDVPAHHAARAGVRAIAISQTLGFGAVTGSLIRWRCLPQLTFVQVSQISAAVSVTFMACWGIYAVGAACWLGTRIAFSPMYIAVIVLVSFSMLIVAVSRGGRFVPQMKTVQLWRLFGFTGIDILFAATALYVVLPPGISVEFTTVLAAYVIALGAGLMTNTPGGAGAFDLTLITLLDGQEQLVAALIVFRCIYYVIPAVIAFLAISTQPLQVKDELGPAQWKLANQTGTVFRIGAQNWLIGDLPFFQCSIGARPPRQKVNVERFANAALKRGKCPVLYNCDPRMASAAVRAGWYVKRVAMEAIIYPQTWTITGRNAQTLRRKLRHAQKAGITVAPHTDAHDESRLAQIARGWATNHAGELGFSMGRFSLDALANQNVFVIRHHNQLVGFVSFFTRDTDWHLNLIRYDVRLPDGAIHAAIVAAIHAARQENIASVSLATAPDPRHTPHIWSQRRQGLIQFKRSFSPAWLPRYHAAPNRVAFYVSGLAIVIAVYRPLANLPSLAAYLTKICALELKFPPRRDKRDTRRNRSPEKS